MSLNRIIGLILWDGFHHAFRDGGFDNMIVKGLVLTCGSNFLTFLKVLSETRLLIPLIFFKCFTNYINNMQYGKSKKITIATTAYLSMEGYGLGSFKVAT